MHRQGWVLASIAVAVLAAHGCAPANGGGTLSPTAIPVTAPTVTPGLASPTAAPAAAPSATAVLGTDPTMIALPSPFTEFTTGPRGQTGAGDINTLIDEAKKDLAAREGIGQGDITVVRTSQETWRDTGLGCPEPGRVYAQVLTPGYRIVLETGGKQFEYHTGAGQVVQCPNPTGS